LTLKGWILIFVLFYFSTQFAFTRKYEQIKLKLTIKFYQYLEISFLKEILRKLLLKNQRSYKFLSFSSIFE
ncbi:MAG: hypothetical protein ACK55Z_14350, partial [bacterium]